MQTLQHAALAPHLDRIASGGEGIVYRVSSMPRTVFKQYKETQRPQLDAAALSELVQVVDQWVAPDKARVLSRTAWPSALVADDRGVCGFLMVEIDDPFYGHFGLRANPRRVLCDWNQLIYQTSTPTPAHLISDMPRVQMEGIVQLLQDLAATIEILHRKSIVVGDMSGKNLIWTVAPNRVFIIDCDSFHFDGQRGACSHKESPGWVDPVLMGRPTNLESDVYKLGVAAYRALAHDAHSPVTRAQVTQRLTGTSIPAALVDLIASSVEPTGRPIAADWSATLASLFKFGGRPTIGTRASQAGPPTSSLGPSRPRIDLGSSPSS